MQATRTIEHHDRPMFSDCGQPRTGGVAWSRNSPAGLVDSAPSGLDALPSANLEVVCGFVIRIEFFRLPEKTLVPATLQAFSDCTFGQDHRKVIPSAILTKKRYR